MPFQSSVREWRLWDSGVGKSSAMPRTLHESSKHTTKWRLGSYRGWKRACVCVCLLCICDLGFTQVFAHGGIYVHGWAPTRNTSCSMCVPAHLSLGANSQPSSTKTHIFEAIGSRIGRAADEVCILGLIRNFCLWPMSTTGLHSEAIVQSCVRSAHCTCRWISARSKYCCKFSYGW